MKIGKKMEKSMIIKFMRISKAVINEMIRFWLIWMQLMLNEMENMSVHDLYQFHLSLFASELN